MITFILCSIVGIYLVLILLLYMFQNRLVFRPARDLVNSPANYGLKYQEVFFQTQDKVNLWGWYVPANNCRAVLLFCHGNDGNLTYLMDSIRVFYKLGLSVFIFDYRGYGKSHGSPTEKGTYTDGKAAWNYLTHEKGILPNKIIIFGRSLGSGIATFLAQKYCPKALILEASFTSIPNLGREFYPFFPIRSIVRIQYNNLQRLRNIQCPLLVIHSENDPLIPFSHGQKLFACANQPKEFLKINGGHADGFLTCIKVYYTKINDFIFKYEQKKEAVQI